MVVSRNLEEMPELLTAREVGKYFRVSALTVKRWIKKNRLPYLRINLRGDYRVRKSEIIKFLNTGKFLNRVVNQ